MEQNKPKPLTMVRGRGVGAVPPPPPPRNKWWLSSPDKFPWAIGHVFLAIATNQIARTMFGDEWSGIEPTFYRSPPHIPERPEVQRFDRVKREIAQLAAGGILKTLWRHTDGGVLRAIDPSAWQTESLDNRFSLCQMNLNDPFSRGIAGDGFGYIFVTEASLAHALTGLAPAGPKLTASAEGQCKDWLAHEVAKCPDTRPRPKDEFWAEAKEEFPALSRRAFERTWASTVPLEWSRRGRTKRNPRT